MSKKENQDMVVEFTPLEKIEALYSELTDWYGEADNKELRVAAKLLMVSLEKFSIYGGADWHELVNEYVDILKNDPEQFQKILRSNRGELKDKKSTGNYH
jgi:GTP1/Obg family GTP-binding protein